MSPAQQQGGGAVSPRALQNAPPRVQESAFSAHGWSVAARTGPIVSSATLEQYADSLGGVLTLPEITFGDSSLALTHQASGVMLSFSALDALRQWKADDLPPLRVSSATEWQAARMAEIQQQQAVVLRYDWTFTTSYAGSLGWASAQRTGAGSQQQQQQQLGAGSTAGVPLPPPPQQQEQQQGGAAAAAAAPAAPAPAAAAAAPTAAAQQAAPDPPPQAHGPQAALDDAGAPPLPSWQPSGCQIDRRLLMRKEEPIQFYAEVPLYESELDDNGVAQLSVKVRVMPRCWLVLLRFWLRVDGCLVRLRETRFFCRLDAPSPVIIRETKLCEGTMAELAAAGAPSSVAGYEDADAAAGVFSAIAPQCLRLFELHELALPGGAAGSGGQQLQCG